MTLAIEDMIARFGPVAVLVGAAVEGEVTMLLAGVAAHLGLIDFTGAVCLGTLGGFSSDALFYSIGRRRHAAIRGSWIYRRVGPAIEALAGRLGILQIALARFIFGTRMATMLLWGMRDLGFVRFAVVDLAGCTAWAIVLGGLGYFMSDSATALVGRVRRVELWLLGALIVAIVLFGAAHAVSRRRRSLRSGAPDDSKAA